MGNETEEPDVIARSSAEEGGVPGLCGAAGNRIEARSKYDEAPTNSYIIISFVIGEPIEHVHKLITLRGQRARQ
jgi:hypothetical protein